MSDPVHNFAPWKRKRDVSFKRAVDAIPEVARGEGPDVQAIVISGSPEMGSNDQPDLENSRVKGSLSEPRSDPSDPSSRESSWPVRETLVYQD